MRARLAAALRRAADRLASQPPNPVHVEITLDGAKMRADLLRLKRRGDPGLG